MLTLDMAKKAVEERERALARTQEELETARAAVADVRLRGDGTQRVLVGEALNFASIFASV